MSGLPTNATLVEVLANWEPSPTETTHRVDTWPAAAFAALLDAASPVGDGSDGDGNGVALPPLWHWFTLLDAVAQRDLGPDGHPVDGAFLPPIPHRRRMFAGGRLWQWAPLRVGAVVTSRASVAGVKVRAGRSGEMAFVTVREELHADGRHVATEEKDLVYRSEPPGTSQRTVGPPGPSDVTGEYVRSLTVDPTVLFRFSALTFNAHRIHYDLPYATDVEGYPGLVVHGPLLALLALELPRRHRPGRPVREFAYRLVRPVFAPVELAAVGRGADGGLDVVVGARGCEPSLTATVRFADHGEEEQR